MLNVPHNIAKAENVISVLAFENWLFDKGVTSFNSEFFTIEEAPNRYLLRRDNVVIGIWQYAPDIRPRLLH